MGLCAKFGLHLFFLACGFFLSACQLTSSREPMSADLRNANALEIAKQGGWTRMSIPAGDFNLISFQPKEIEGEVLRVYIEGDGHAWKNSQVASDDPTPINPVALRLALADPSHSSLYLARPCQFQMENEARKFEECSSRYWTNERFSESVISSINVAIDKLKIQYKAKKVFLIGYSGGGAIALLCAAKRDDVEKIITVAGNVSVKAWTRELGLNELKGSLDPVDYVQNLKKIPQWHFIGLKDEVVPPNMMTLYVAHFPKGAPIQIISLNEFGHQCCWENQWPLLLKQAQ